MAQKRDGEKADTDVLLLGGGDDNKKGGPEDALDE
jgi:hypothetical protein